MDATSFWKFKKLSRTVYAALSRKTVPLEKTKYSQSLGPVLTYPSLLRKMPKTSNLELLSESITSLLLESESQMTSRVSMMLLAKKVNS